MTTADGSVIGTTQIFGNAPRSTGFNVVLLADGFTAAQQTNFDTAASAFVAALLATAPYGEYQSVINVFRVNVSSTESGADDPVEAGGSGSSVKTYFDASFGGATNGVRLRRLLVCDQATAMAVANAQVPEHSVVLVVVNSAQYGGGGGGVGTFSLHPDATEIALHETGHSAYGLADEYAYLSDVTGETGHDHHPSVEPPQANATINTDRGTLKWVWAVQASTPLPTKTNPDASTVDTSPSAFPAGTIGLFEGADHFHAGAYRPEFTCKMNVLGDGFCRVCRQAIRNRLDSHTRLTGRASAPITAVARYQHSIDVFAPDITGRVMGQSWDRSTGTGWSGWYNLELSGGASPGGPGSPVTAVSRHPDRIDVFTVGADRFVHTRAWSAGTWSAWSQVGALTCRPGSIVTVVSRNPDQMDLFTTAFDGGTISIWWSAKGGWAANWFRLSGGTSATGASVSAVARRPTALEVFTVGQDNQVYVAGWQSGKPWSSWMLVPGITCRPDSKIAVVSRFATHLDVFTTDSAGRTMSTWWDENRGWATWFQVAGGAAPPGSDITAVARDRNHLDVFVIGTDTGVYATRWGKDVNGGAWAPWSNVSGGVSRLGGQVSVISRLPDHLDVFVVGSDDYVYSTWGDGSGLFAPWFRLGVG